MTQYFLPHRDGQTDNLTVLTSLPHPPTPIHTLELIIAEQTYLHSGPFAQPDGSVGQGLLWEESQKDT